MFWKPYLLSLLVSGAVASKPVEIVAGAFIVEYEDVADPSSFLDHVGATKTMDLNFELFNGATVQFDDKKPTGERIAQLLALPSIKNVWPKKIYPAPDDQVHWVASPGSTGSHQVVRRSKGNDTFSTHVQTQVDKLRAKGFTGKGVKIAIVDSGIDYTNKALGGCFGPNCLVIGGYDFVGDNYNASNTPVPDNDPLDTCQGHGTHVAGIIAAQPNEYGFTGAAPGAKLSAYRVFGCTGGAGNDVLIAGFMRAYQDGANIITASLGGTSGWSEDELSVVVSRITEKGVIVTVAAGNEGANGLFYGSGPAGGKNIAAIASYDNTLTPVLVTTSRYAVAGGAEQDFDYAIGSPRNWAGVKLPLWPLSFNTNETNQGCNPFPDDTPDLSNKVVLIRRGTCAFQVKAQNAAARGAKYVMFYNNVPGKIFIALEKIQNITAIGMVPDTLGATWVTDLAAGKVVTLDMADPNANPIRLEQDPNNKTGGFLSSYTTWGPSFEGDMKPTFGTPGGNILSTYPVALGSFAVLSGTSMATPLAAAIYALLSNVRGTFDPLELQNVLATTAKPVQANSNGVITPLLAPIAQQGAGMIQAYDAAYATTILSESGLAFNDTVRLTNKKFIISNTGYKAVTYELDVIGAATAYTFSDSKTPDPYPGLELDGSFANVHLSEYKVTVPPGGKSTITVKVTPPSLTASRLPVYGGYIRLNGTNGERLSLPYQGIAGDLSAPTVLNNTYVSTSSAAPDFAPIIGGNSTFLFPRINITNITDDIPVAAINMLFGSPLINIEILSTSNYTTNLGHAMDSPLQWAPRNLISYFWNGQLADKSFVPAGSYKFRVSALHIFGDASNKKQYDVTESPTFTIKYK